MVTAVTEYLSSHPALAVVILAGTAFAAYRLWGSACIVFRRFHYGPVYLRMREGAVLSYLKYAGNHNLVLRQLRHLSIMMSGDQETPDLSHRLSEIQFSADSLMPNRLSDILLADPDDLIRKITASEMTLSKIEDLLTSIEVRCERLIGEVYNVRLTVSMLNLTRVEAKQNCERLSAFFAAIPYPVPKTIKI